MTRYYFSSNTSNQIGTVHEKSLNDLLQNMHFLCVSEI